MKDLIKKYLDKGFGSMNKNAFEVFIFNEIMKNPYEILEIDSEIKLSNYDISLKLKIPETKVKRLAYEADLAYGGENREAECRKKLLQAIEKVKFKCDKKENTKVSFVIEEFSVRKYLEHKLKQKGTFIDFATNNEVVIVSIDDFSELIKDLFPKEEQEAICKNLKKASTANFKDVLTEILNSVAKKEVGNVIALSSKYLIGKAEEMIKEKNN